ncbi:MAG TPA: SPFH domain-containing protein [Longimicrobiaceae bacterium]|nr:SPFH domain-containing protein [Longimicrobiaceae bacterium]
MAFWKDFVKSELVDIVEWLDDGSTTLVHRFERHDNEIKNGAQLVVRPGQAAVFVNEGQIADVFAPGTYTLVTQNLPILSTLRGWKYGFDSPFKAEVYFVSTRQFTDQKWGTRNPIMTRDPEFGPVRLRAFGSFAYRVSEPAKFVCEIVGTNGHFQTDGIGDQLRNLIVTRFSDAVGEGKIPVLDLAGNLNEMGTRLTQQIGPEFAEYGIEITKLLVENVSLPEEVEKALDKRSSMGVLGNLGAYTQFQAANAIEAAAKNPGGDASAGMGLGMGFAMANQMAQAMNPGAAGAHPQAGGPPPLPQAAQYYVAINGQQSGPHGMDALRQHVGAGTLNQETLVWRDGMAGWTRAADVGELASLFPAGPPPLPS